MSEPTKVITNENGTFYYSTNKANNTRRVDADYDNDGKIDASSAFFEDENGNTIKNLYDGDGDGKYDEVSLFEYDDEGKLKARYDGNTEYNYFYDENGKISDINQDGKIDSNDKVKRHENFDEYVTFSYDENGNISESEPKELNQWKKHDIQEKSTLVEQKAQIFDALENRLQKPVNKKD